VTEFKAGQRIMLGIPGTVVGTYPEDDLGFDFKADDEYYMPQTTIASMSIKSGAVKAEAIDPANWPPKPGEVWDTESGTRYVTRQHRTIKGCVVINPADNGSSFYDGELDKFKALNPRRVFPAA
jgi:hypothetical protein